VKTIGIVLLANKIANQCGQTIVLAVRPAIFDGDIPASTKPPSFKP
jgi:hypothetical protein